MSFGNNTLPRPQNMTPQPSGTHHEDYEVDEEYRPEDRDVENAEQGHAERRQHGLLRGQPELELRQASAERPAARGEESRTIVMVIHTTTTHRFFGTNKSKKLNEMSALSAHGAQFARVVTTDLGKNNPKTNTPVDGTGKRPETDGVMCRA